MATIYEVSDLAGVSLATVSRVMNKNARVSEKTEKKVREAMEVLGYRPNSMARSLASNCSNSVGVLVSELQGPFFGDMMCGIESELRVSGRHVIIAAGHSEEAAEKDGIEFLIARNCDALILHSEVLSDEYLLELSKGSIPVVLINRDIPGFEDNCISLNNELGGYLAARSVLERGHKNIAYIAGPLWKSDAKERYDGHQRALRESGVELNTELTFEGDFHAIGGSNGIDRSVTLACLVLLGSISLITGNVRRRCDLLVRLGCSNDVIRLASGCFGSVGTTRGLSVDWRSSEEFAGLHFGNGISSLEFVLRVTMGLFTSGILRSMLALDIG